MAHMRPATHNLEIYKGDTFQKTFRFRLMTQDPVTGEWTVPGAYIDLTGATGKAQIRESSADPDVGAEFAVTVLDQVSTPGGIKIRLESSVTATLPEKKLRWDIQLQDSASNIRTYLAGDVTVIGEITTA